VFDLPKGVAIVPFQKRRVNHVMLTNESYWTHCIHSNVLRSVLCNTLCEKVEYKHWFTSTASCLVRDRMAPLVAAYAGTDF
jgi:hypothetical protein